MKNKIPLERLKAPVLLVDTLNMFYWSGFSHACSYDTLTEQEFLMRGWFDFLYRLSQLDYSSITFALESTVPTRRSLMYPAYKAHRVQKTPLQMALIQKGIDLLSDLGFKTLRVEGFEADDVIATLTKRYLAMGQRVHILSLDKDLYTLIRKGCVSLVLPTMIPGDLMTESACIKRFGVKPDMLLDYLALVGDASDGVTGVDGLGRGSAKRLIRRFGSLEKIYEYGAHRYNPKMDQALQKGREKAFFNRTLMRLEEDLILPDGWDQACIPRISLK